MHLGPNDCMHLYQVVYLQTGRSFQQGAQFLRRHRDDAGVHEVDDGFQVLEVDIAENYSRVHAAWDVA